METLRNGVFPHPASASGLRLGRDACFPDFHSSRPCSPNAPCPGGTLCNQSGKCQVFQNLQCAAGVCHASGECGAACVEDDDCGNGHRCRQVLVGSNKGTLSPDDDSTTVFNTCCPGTAAKTPAPPTATAPTASFAVTAWAQTATTPSPVGSPTTARSPPVSGAVMTRARSTSGRASSPATATCATSTASASTPVRPPCSTTADCGDTTQRQCARDPLADFWGTDSGICVWGKPCSLTADCDGDAGVCALLCASDDDCSSLQECVPAPWGYRRDRVTMACVDR